MITPDASMVSTSLKAYQDLAVRLMEFSLINARSALKFAQDVSAAKSPQDIADALVDYGRRQFECWTEELEELSAVSGVDKKRDPELAGLGD
jgi:hypothetical protein